jgi:aspartate racemase
MKTIGLLGGMSWESTAEYYKIINNEVKQRLGGLHSAKIILNSVDFHEVELLQKKGDWEAAAQFMLAGARQLEKGGADCLLICTNTMHKIADFLIDKLGIPLLHIADATAHQIVQQGIRKVGLIGTRFTMEQDFYRGKLERDFNLEVLIPEEEQRVIVHNVIYEELCKGIINNASRLAYIQVLKDLENKGAKGIILGCTEIGLLVTQADSPLPLFDTAKIHAKAAVDFALS